MIRLLVLQEFLTRLNPDLDCSVTKPGSTFVVPVAAADVSFSTTAVELLPVSAKLNFVLDCPVTETSFSSSLLHYAQPGTSFPVAAFCTEPELSSRVTAVTQPHEGEADPPSGNEEG